MRQLKLRSVLSLAPAMLLATPILAQAGPVRDGYHGHMWGDGFGAGFMGFGMMILVWGAIIFLVVLAVRWFLAKDDNAWGGQSALDILKDRLAKGEIEIEDYEARRKALEG